MATILPVGDTSEIAARRDTVRWAVLLAPLVGLGLGLVAGIALIVARIALAFTYDDPIPPTGEVPTTLAAAVLAVAAIQWLLGGLRREGSTGSATGLALVLLIQVSMLAVAVGKGHGTAAVITATVAGQVAMVWTARLPPAARGKSGAWAGSVSTLQAVVVTGVSLLAPVGLLAVDDDPVRISSALVVLAIPLAALVTAIQAGRWSARPGGVTRDVLAASTQIGTTVALVATALAG